MFNQARNVKYFHESMRTIWEYNHVDEKRLYDVCPSGFGEDQWLSFYAGMKTPFWGLF
eukprot:UN03694